MTSEEFTMNTGIKQPIRTERARYCTGMDVDDALQIEGALRSLVPDTSGILAFNDWMFMARADKSGVLVSRRSWDSLTFEGFDGVGDVVDYLGNYYQN